MGYSPASEFSQFAEEFEHIVMGAEQRDEVNSAYQKLPCAPVLLLGETSYRSGEAVSSYR